MCMVLRFGKRYLRDFTKFQRSVLLHCTWTGKEAREHRVQLLIPWTALKLRNSIKENKLICASFTLPPKEVSPLLFLALISFFALFSLHCFGDPSLVSLINCLSSLPLKTKLQLQSLARGTSNLSFHKLC